MVKNKSNSAEERSIALHYLLLLASFSIFLVTIASSFYFLWKTCFILNLSNPGFISFIVSVCALMLLFVSTLYFYKENLPIQLKKENASLQKANDELLESNAALKGKAERHDFLEAEKSALQAVNQQFIKEKFEVEKTLNEKLMIIQDIDSELSTLKDLYSRTLIHATRSLEGLSELMNRAINQLKKALPDNSIPNLVQQPSEEATLSEGKEKKKKKGLKIFTASKQNLLDLQDGSVTDTDIRPRSNSKVIASIRSDAQALELSHLLKTLQSINQELNNLSVRLNSHEVNQTISPLRIIALTPEIPPQHSMSFSGSSRISQFARSASAEFLDLIS